MRVSPDWYVTGAPVLHEQQHTATGVITDYHIYWRRKRKDAQTDLH